MSSNNENCHKSLKTSVVLLYHAQLEMEASINLMSLSIFRRLGLGEACPTTVTLQLANRSLKHPRGGGGGGGGV